MINLIPPQGQKKLQREYLFRSTIVFSILFGFVFLLLFAALIPTYVLVSAQINALTTSSLQDSSKAEQYTKIESETKSLEKIISQLEKATSTKQVSPLIDEVVAITPDGVTVQSFTISEEKGIVQKVQLQGTARTRSSLVQFRNALEGSSYFKKADVPLSDLAKDSDLPFNISVLLR